MSPASPASPYHFLRSEYSRDLLLSPVGEPLPLRAAQSPATVPHLPPPQSTPRAAQHAQPHETVRRIPPRESSPPAAQRSRYCTRPALPETHPFPFSQTDRTYAAAASCAAPLPPGAGRTPLCPTANSSAQNHPHPAESGSEAYSCVARDLSRETRKPIPCRDSARLSAGLFLQKAPRPRAAAPAPVFAETTAEPAPHAAA